MLFSSIRSATETRKSLRQRVIWLPFILHLLALSALAVALARPQYGMERVKHSHESVAIEMLMDISSSMDMSMTNDVAKESRLEVAKEVFEQFVVGDGETLGGRSDDLIGMVTFARYADTVCPLTLGHDALLHFARNLHIEEREAEDGTAIGDALALGAARLKTTEHALRAQSYSTDNGPEIKSKVIILLTDGENNSGKHLPLEGAALARKWGVRVHTIGFGDRREPLTVETEDRSRQIMPALGADTKTLVRIAEATGGIFRMAHDAESLRAVYQEIDRMEKSAIKSMSYLEYTEQFRPFAVAALAVIFTEALLACTVLRRIP